MYENFLCGLLSKQVSLHQSFHHFSSCAHHAITQFCKVSKVDDHDDDDDNDDNDDDDDDDNDDDDFEG